MNWHEYFTYDADTGDLVWKVRPREHFTSNRAWNIFNARRAGKVAGHIEARMGYSQVGINGQLVPSHRIIWEMHNGPIPDGMEVDHKDGDGSNNRIWNFRLATHAQNQRNTRRPKNNTSGVKGVPKRPSGAWRARVNVYGIEYYLGLFPTKGLAAVARAKAALRYHGQFARFS